MVEARATPAAKCVRTRRTLFTQLISFTVDEFLRAASFPCASTILVRYRTKSRRAVTPHADARLRMNAGPV
jgi:hypothetical protein